MAGALGSNTHKGAFIGMTGSFTASPQTPGPLGNRRGLNDLTSS